MTTIRIYNSIYTPKTNEVEQYTTVFDFGNGGYYVRVKPPTQDYRVYTPTEQNRVWRVFPQGQGVIKVADPSLLFSVRSLEQEADTGTIKIAGTMSIGMISVAFLACKLFGWAIVGHWGLYLAAFAISAYAATTFALANYQTHFHIANRIISVIDHANKGQAINEQSKLSFEPDTYCITAFKKMAQNPLFS